MKRIYLISGTSEDLYDTSPIAAIPSLDLLESYFEKFNYRVVSKLMNDSIGVIKLKDENDITFHRVITSVPFYE